MSRNNAASWNVTGVGTPGLDTAQQFTVSMARLQAYAVKAMIDHNLEAVDFIGHRLRRDADFVTRMAASKDIAEAVQLCADFWQKAVAEYSAETRKLAAMKAEPARSTAVKFAKATGATDAPAPHQLA